MATQLIKAEFQFDRYIVNTKDIQSETAGMQTAVSQAAVAWLLVVYIAGIGKYLSIKSKWDAVISRVPKRCFQDKMKYLFA